MRLTRREFHRLVFRSLQELPPRIRGALENVAVLVEDWPSVDDLEEAGLKKRRELFGLYTGVPLPDRAGGLPPLPDTITLFQRPIESVCASRDEVGYQLRVTLLHEVGHYLGMSEDDLDQLGYG